MRVKVQMQNSGMIFENRDGCPLCGERDRRPFGTLQDPLGRQIEYQSCGACGAVYMNPVPTNDSLAAFYREVYGTPEYRAIDGYSRPRYAEEFELAKASREQMMNFVKMFRKPPGRMLDVGCGYGGLMWAAMRQGWRAEGIEASDDLVRFGTDTLGIPIRAGSFPDSAGDYPEITGEKFDIITMFEFVEHIRKPMDALVKAAELSAPGGHLFLTFPDALSPAAKSIGKTWIGWKPPTHLQFLDIEQISRLMKKAGWTPLYAGPGGGYPGQLMAVACR